MNKKSHNWKSLLHRAVENPSEISMTIDLKTGSKIVFKLTAYTTNGSLWTYGQWLLS